MVEDVMHTSGRGVCWINELIFLFYMFASVATHTWVIIEAGILLRILRNRLTN